MTNAKRKQKSEQTSTSNPSEKSHLEPVAPDLSAATEPESTPALLGTTPIYKERLGRVHLAIWAREDKKGTVRFSVKLSRNYKTENGFRDTNSLDQGDLANAIALLTQAQSALPPMAVIPEPHS